MAGKHNDHNFDFFMEKNDMTLEGLGQIFEGYSAETCAGKIPLLPMGTEQRVLHARTREQGPPSALEEFFTLGVGGTLLAFTPEGIVVGF